MDGDGMLYDIMYTDGTFDRCVPLPEKPVKGTRYAQNTNWDGHRLIPRGVRWTRETKGGAGCERTV